jgi:predicted HicB family RNase H-like nuclease
MKTIALRIDDDLASTLAAAAVRQGVSASAIIRRALVEGLSVQDSTGAVAVPIERSSKGRLTIRFDEREIAAIDAFAQDQGFSRSEWIKSVIRWQVWDQAGQMRLAPNHIRAILRVVAQVRKIGYSLNQAVKAMNAANRPGATIETQRAAQSVLAMKAELRGVIEDVLEQIESLAVGEVAWWTVQSDRWIRKGAA